MDCVEEGYIKQEGSELWKNTKKMIKTISAFSQHAAADRNTGGVDLYQICK